MNIYFYTLGCKVNQYETQALKQIFFDAGYIITENVSLADVFIINSCTVTNVSDKKTKQNLRKFKKLNPNAIIAVIGCFPQAFPEQAESLIEADIIMGTHNKSNLIKNIENFLQNNQKIIDIKKLSKNDSFENMKVSSYSEKTRAFIKIQDGCNRYCTYCIIPSSRGYLKSKPIKELKEEVEDLAKMGYKEIVLVGINLCFYGENEDYKLIDAIEMISSIEAIKRIRLGSLEPEKMTIDTLKRMSKLDKFCPQFHLSLQSGDDSVLKRMRRNYKSDEYLEIVEMINKYFDNPSITTDIIVGFPEETKDEFQNSLNFIEKCKMAKVHAFPYSKRDGTKAAKMENQIDESTKKLRVKELIKKADDIRQKFFKTQVGKSSEILIEKRIDENTYEGYSKNYTPVIVKSEKDICGQIVNVCIYDYNYAYCLGNIDLKNSKS